jgi:nuclear GTP-binding protein
LTNSFGKGSLIALLRQFALLHSDRKQISVGFIGYPNTGKSSIINTLRKKVVCKTAPIPGETKIWQYITLTRRIYLIDCPGVVPPNPSDSDTDLLLRGVVRVENVEYPSQYMSTMLSKCQERHIERTYGIKGWSDEDAFLEMMARKGGRLLKGGEPDIEAVARMILSDFLRGKIPWYVPPPKANPDGEEGTGEVKEGLKGRQGRLGEMRSGSGKRKRADEDVGNEDEISDIGSVVDTDADEEDQDAFGGLDNDEADSQDDIDEDDVGSEVDDSDGSDPGGA